MVSCNTIGTKFCFGAVCECTDFFTGKLCDIEVRKSDWNIDEMFWIKPKTLFIISVALSGPKAIDWWNPVARRTKSKTEELYNDSKASINIFTSVNKLPSPSFYIPPSRIQNQKIRFKGNSENTLFICKKFFIRCL